MTKKRFYFTLLVLALIVLALPGFATRAGRRLTGPITLRGAAASLHSMAPRPPGGAPLCSSGELASDF